MNKAFQVFQSLRGEKLGPGKAYYNHQLCINQAYDMPGTGRIINISEPGVGKTAHYFLPAFTMLNSGRIRKAFIVQPKSIINQAKENIIFKLTNGVYWNESIMNAKSDSTRRSAMTRALSAHGISMMTYDSFFKYVELNCTTNGEYDVAKICEFFDNTYIACDEIHVMRKNENRAGQEKEKHHRAIMTILNNANNVYFQGCTATPIVNNPQELIRIMNYVLEPERQLPESMKISELTHAQIQNIMRGKVYYVRADLTMINVRDMGERLNIAEGYRVGEGAEERIIQSQIVVKTSIMQPDGYQQQVYTKIMRKFNKDASGDYDPSEGEVSSSLYHAERQCLLGVYPPRPGTSDPLQGNEGFNYYMVRKENPDEEGGKSKEVRGVPSNELLQEIVHNGRSISCEYDDIRNIERSSPGCGYLYIDSVTGTGCLLAAAFMSTVVYHEPGSPIDGKQFVEFTDSTVAVTSGGIQMDKRPRYAIITSDQETTHTSKIREICQSVHNIDGHYIKFVIFSAIAQVGISFANARRFYIAIGQWARAFDFQAENRVLRADSHIAMWMREIERENRMRRLKGQMKMTAQEENQIKVPVDIYRLAAVPGKYIDAEKTMIDQHDSLPKIAYNFYLDSERKNIINQTYIRDLRLSDFALYLNWNRNVRQEDVPYTEACCFGPAFVKPKLPEIQNPDYYNNSSASDSAVASLVQTIRDELRDFAILTSETIKRRYVKGYGQFLVYKALEICVNPREKFYDRYGFRCFVNIDPVGNIYLCRDKDEKPPQIHGSNAAFNVYLEDRIKFEEAAKAADREVHQSDIEEIMNMPPGKEYIKTYQQKLAALSADLQVAIFEKAVREPPHVYYAQFVKIYYSKDYNTIDAYDTSIQAVARGIAAGQIKELTSQNKSIGGKTSKNKDIPLIDPTPGAFMIVHRIKNKENNSYSATSVTNNHQNLRIARQDANGISEFHDANSAETSVIRQILEQNGTEENILREKIPVGDYYGTMINGTFRLCLRLSSDQEKDVRKRHSGRAIQTISINLQVYLLALGNVSVQSIYNDINADSMKPSIAEVVNAYLYGQTKLPQNPRVINLASFKSYLVKYFYTDQHLDLVDSFAIKPEEMPIAQERLNKIRNFVEMSVVMSDFFRGRAKPGVETAQKAYLGNKVFNLFKSQGKIAYLIGEEDYDNLLG